MNSKKVNTFKLEYIWLDGNDVQLLRSKTKVNQTEKNIEDIKLEDLKDWNYDGSSTEQAAIENSELIIKPVNIFRNPFDYDSSLLIMCEVYYPDGSPHESNKRSKLVETANKDKETWYGFEQEYIIFDKETDRPLGWPVGQKSFPEPQGKYYCGIGADHVAGREFVDEHLNKCVKIGIQISGVNAEVALGQWEYQVGPVPAIEGSDQLWISRYILYRLGEKYGYSINIEPKPFPGDDINGSGMHVNFSTKELRENLTEKAKIAIKYCEKLEKSHKEHILVYGKGNEVRLTGENETASYNEFTFGVGARNVSIRIPNSINDDKTPGYIEDRRPGSNGDPYVIVEKIIDTIC